MTEPPPWDHIDELVVAAAAPDEALSAEIDRIGTAKVADLLAAEVQVRCPQATGIDDLVIRLAILAGAETHSYLVTFKDGEMLLSLDGGGEVLAEIRYTILDLVRLLYPPREGYTSTSRDVRIITWPWERDSSRTDPAQLEELRQQTVTELKNLVRRGQEISQTLYRAVQYVITACSSAPVSLNDLSVLYGSDKWGALHWFTQHYEAHFASLRTAPLRILEIGIGGYHFEDIGGQSLYMWQRYFPRGLVFGLDIHAKPGISGPRIRTIQGDQNDAASLRRLAEAHGPFDIIIDDGSHINEHVRTSFEALFPYVRPGGTYVIEDLHTSYWPALGGEAPPGSSRTSVGMLKDLLDAIQYREHTDLDDDEAAAATHPSEVHMYHNLAFLKKGVNNEQGIPAWIRDRGDWQNA
jgi:hypothetical protein